MAMAKKSTKTAIKHFLVLVVASGMVWAAEGRLKPPSETCSG
jgi:hypothetical protein